LGTKGPDALLQLILRVPLEISLRTPLLQQEGECDPAIGDARIAGREVPTPLPRNGDKQKAGTLWMPA